MFFVSLCIFIDERAPIVCFVAMMSSSFQFGNGTIGRFKELDSSVMLMKIITAYNIGSRFLFVVSAVACARLRPIPRTITMKVIFINFFMARDTLAHQTNTFKLFIFRVRPPRTLRRDNQNGPNEMESEFGTRPMADKKNGFCSNGFGVYLVVSAS